MVKLKLNFLFANDKRINHKKINWTPWVVLSHFPLGIKVFGTFKKEDSQLQIETLIFALGWSNNLKEKSIGPYRESWRTSLLGDKGSSNLKKGRFPFTNWHLNFGKPDTYKMERPSSGPLRICFRKLRAIKAFVTFKKADYQGKIKTSIFASQPHIKMERLSSGPSRALLSQFPSGDKGFQDFKKAYYYCKIETSIFASQRHIKMERLSSGPSRSLLSQFPSGDKTIL